MKNYNYTVPVTPNNEEEDFVDYRFMTQTPNRMSPDYTQSNRYNQVPENKT
jgi:hypothetical protein